MQCALGYWLGAGHSPSSNSALLVTSLGRAVLCSVRVDTVACLVVGIVSSGEPREEIFH